MAKVITKAEFTRYKRQLFVKALKDFWRQYKRRKMGLVGLFILVLFAAMGLAAPVIALYDPLVEKVFVEPTVPPEWMRWISPAHRDLPRAEFYALNPRDAKVEKGGIAPEALKFSGAEHSLIAYENPTDASGISWISLSHTIDYPYKTLKTFVVRFDIDVENLQEYDVFEGKGLRVRLSLFIRDERGGREYDILIDKHKHWILRSERRGLKIYSTEMELRRLHELPTGVELAERIFRSAGKYALVLNVTIHDAGAIKLDRAKALTIRISPINFEIKGMLHGLLGTNYMSQDVWSQFVHGIRISFTVGLLVAATVLLIGVVLGLIAGYKGGTIDRSLIGIFDTIILMPILPIILLTIMILKEPHIYLIIFIIALFSWPWLARYVRSWTYSLKERAFVESAKVIGASDTYIMFKYVLPQMAPLMVYYVTIIIPSAILTEAALSLLGFGDPRAPSWGKMIEGAWHHGALAAGAWWWVAPPVIGLIALAMGFVFIGFTLDEIVNPRLRRR